MNISVQLINLVINKDLSETAQLIRNSGENRETYVKLVKESIDYYAKQVDELISLVNTDKYNNDDLVYPKEDCMGNFYKNQEYFLTQVSIEKQTAVIGEGNVRLTELDFETLDEYFYKK